MDERIAFRGPALQVEFAALSDGSMPAKKFIDELSDSDRAKIVNVIERLAEQGRVSNREKFKKIEGTNFFEIKSFQVRIPGFYLPGKRFVLTHGFIKKSHDTPRCELDRAERIRRNCSN